MLLTLDDVHLNFLSTLASTYRSPSSFLTLLLTVAGVSAAVLWCICPGRCLVRGHKRPHGQTEVDIAVHQPQTQPPAPFPLQQQENQQSGGPAQLFTDT